MRNVNCVHLIGNLTRDPVLKEMDNGQAMIMFGMATNRDWTSNGERKTDAQFHNIVAWGKLAEICDKLLERGRLVYVEGYLKTRTWDNPDGTRNYKTEIVATDVILLDRRGEGESAKDDKASKPQELTSEEKEMEAMKSDGGGGDDSFENLIE